ncbi:MAG: 30S ribosomal protein S2 [Planctomycetota bacterium]
MAIVQLKELLDSGIHFGTSSSLWHPRMAPYLYGKRGGIHIIDVRQTAKQLIHAYYYAAKLARANKTLLFVGTKRQAKDVIRDSAKAAGMPFVAERWLGGTLTNFETVRTSIRRLDDIEARVNTAEYMRESKKIQSRDGRERRRILRNLEGVRTMAKLPDAIFLVDPKHEETAIREARRLSIPLIGLVDSDTDPTLVDLPIPGNDDGIRPIQLVVKVLIDGLARGRSEQVTRVEVPADQQAAAAAATPAVATGPAFPKNK